MNKIMIFLILIIVGLSFGCIDKPVAHENVDKVNVFSVCADFNNGTHVQYDQVTSVGVISGSKYSNTIVLTFTERDDLVLYNVKHFYQIRG